MSDTIHNRSITIILAVYNGGEYLKLAVQSVLDQSLSEFEFLILDDQSTDGSYEWLEQLGEDRIQLFRNDTNRGLFYNLNFLIKKSRTGLIKLWSQDDIMYPHCLSSILNFHQKHPQIGFSYTGRDIIDAHGTILQNDGVDETPHIISQELHARIAYFTGSIAGNIANVCISKSALDRVGLFKEHMKISADFDMWVRIAQYYPIGFISDKLIQLRDHKGQLSRNEKFYINHVKEDLEVYNYLDGYVSDQLKLESKKLLRIKKLPFYYTLMVKAFFRGDIKSGKAYYGLLKKYTDFLSLSTHYFKIKIFKKQIPTFYPHNS